MKMYYVTLNTETEARAVSLELLEKKLAVCTNWFPIRCAYRFNDEIRDEEEMVLIIKTKNNLREEIEATIANHISYTNLIAELDIHSLNNGFLDWLNNAVVS